MFPQTKALHVVAPEGCCDQELWQIHTVTLQRAKSKHMRMGQEHSSQRELMFWMQMASVGVSFCLEFVFVLSRLTLLTFPIASMSAQIFWDAFSLPFLWWWELFSSCLIVFDNLKLFWVRMGLFYKVPALLAVLSKESHLAL